MAWIEVVSGGSGGPWVLGPTESIGSGPADFVQVLGLGVLASHATLAREGEHYVLKPVGTNEVFVNGLLYAAAIVLRDGDVVRLGAVDLRYHTSDVPPQPGQPPPPPWFLVVRPLVGPLRRYDLGDKPIGVGRSSDQHVQIADLGASRRHAVIEPILGGWRLRDLSTPNGTFLNGERIQFPMRLELGQVYRVGDTAILVTDRPESEWAALLGPPRLAEIKATPTPKPAAPTPPEPPRPPSPPSPPPPSHPRGEGGDKLLPKIGRDLTALARAGKLETVIGRKDEIRRLGQILLQKRKPNAILVGEAGVGKTCIVEGLAHRIATGDCPETFLSKKVIEISVASIVAGTQFRGDFEKRVEDIFKEAEADPDLILFLDEIHMAVGAGRSNSTGAMDVANLLKPVLARSSLRVIGATTNAEYTKHVAQDPAFERRFEVVWVEEPTRDEALEMLERLKESYEKHHRVTIEPAALEAAVDLSLRYMKERRLPDKALDVLDQACSQNAMETFRAKRAEEVKRKPVDRAAIARVVAERCRVPVENLLRTKEQRLESVEDFLGQRVVGQPRAVAAVSRALRAAQAGLKDPRRPVGAFLLAGPSGTGKTELAKALAEWLFQDEERLIHLDMSEFAERHTVSRLYGAPPGYLGHDEEGQLTGAIRKNPLAVVLFDEIEKAHPDVLNILLQLLDEGRLTDGKGRRADFREALVVLSTNLGSSDELAARGGLGFGKGAATAEEESQARAQARVARAIEEHLRPEIRNRLTATIVFDALTVESLELIVEKTLAGLERRLAAKKVRLVLSKEARRLLAERAHDPRYGGREVERVVQREVADPLARALVDGAVKAEARVTIGVKDAKITLDVS